MSLPTRLIGGAAYHPHDELLRIVADGIYKRPRPEQEQPKRRRRAR